jgi:hypothetical protein
MRGIFIVEENLQLFTNSRSSKRKKRTSRVSLIYRVLLN